MRHISTILDEVLKAMQDGTLINPECCCPQCGRPKRPRASLCTLCATEVSTWRERNA